PRERAATDLALAATSLTRGAPTLPYVVDALLDPSAESAASVRTDRAALLEDGRDVALELRRLVHGDLRGMFDGPTTPGLDLTGTLVVLDLSALYNSPALGVLMACATAWLQATLARQASAAGAGHVFVVVDEAWAVLANLGVARWLQASWKLSRAYGIANVAVLHRVSDLQSVGAAGSEQVGLASGLLADSETRVVYGQAPGEVVAARELLSLSETEAEVVPQLRRGVALWKVGRRSFLVQHVVGRGEREIVDTDAAMIAAPG
ncbi:MAG: ATP-binding protein, partial [Solirubrobacteraceae bacterium]